MGGKTCDDSGVSEQSMSPGAGYGPSPRARLPLVRPRRGRWIAGVCAGLAAHLEIPVKLVRILMVLLVGIGPALYLWLWVTVPVGDPADAARDARPAVLTRLVPALDTQSTDEPKPRRQVPVTDIAIGLLLLAVAGLLVAMRFGVDVDATWVFPVLISLGGVALAWSQLDKARRDKLMAQAGGRTPGFLVRVVGGLALMLVGVAVFLAQGKAWSEVGPALVAALAMVAGVALVLAPWWLKMMRELDVERAARIREAERADIAAHLHDSVLQTLAIIRSKSADPEFVARVARAQERELRAWLYQDRQAPERSLAESIQEIAAEVEDNHGVPIDVVLVGDRVPDELTEALLMSTREALLNAVVHGAPPVSLYVEAREDAVEVFVRDRGEGFDISEIPEDRLGVKESIMGRMRRRGGVAEVRSTPGSGTEVHLVATIAEGQRESQRNGHGGNQSSKDQDRGT